MRIQSIKEVNTDQQQNPFFMQKVSAVTADKSALSGSFKECLKTHIHDIRVPAAAGKAELPVASALCGYLITQKVASKPELKHRPRAYVSLSDL